MTYARCKLRVNDKLRVVALPYYAGRRKLASMAQHRTYLREWRKFRGYTQEQVVDRIAVLEDPKLPGTAASLSRLERGKQPYSQRVIEALAEIYSCEPADLIGRNPEKEGQIVDFVAALGERERHRALALLRAMHEAEAEMASNG